MTRLKEKMFSWRKREKSPIALQNYEGVQNIKAKKIFNLNARAVEDWEQSNAIRRIFTRQACSA